MARHARHAAAYAVKAATHTAVPTDAAVPPPRNVIGNTDDFRSTFGQWCSRRSRVPKTWIGESPGASRFVMGWVEVLDSRPGQAQGKEVVEMGESRTPRPEAFSGDHYERVR